MKSPILFLTAMALAAPTVALAQPAVPSVSHFMLGISVADMDKMTAWYGEMLGFKVTKEVAMGTGGGKVRFLENGNERIELVYSPDSKPGTEHALPGSPGQTRGFVQLAMEVPDLDAAKPRWSPRASRSASTSRPFRRWASASWYCAILRAIRSNCCKKLKN